MAIYIFCFNNPKDENDIFMSTGHIIREIRMVGSKIPVFAMRLDNQGKRPVNWIKVPVKEGNIYRRSFWISAENEDEAINRGMDIIDDYKKLRWIKAKERLERLEKRG